MVWGVRVKTLEVQLRNDGMQQTVDAGSTGVKHVVRRFFVEWIAHLKQGAQFLEWVVDLQQGSLHVVLQTAKDLLRRGPQVNHFA